MAQEANQLVGESPAFLQALEDVSALAELDKPVLIVGERGTGKELVASRLHFLSPRWESIYVQMNCASLNEELLESELFGHEVGAFTGATRRHLGRFERADTGTLFLDELATTSMRIQEKILRVIEYGEFERVGGSQMIRTNVRIIAATNEDLPSLANDGRFRDDLLDRLAFDVITLPPLRERQSDILMLAEHFALGMTNELEREIFMGFTSDAEETLLDYNWPGNVRELKNVVERAVYRNDGENPIDEIVLDPFDSPYRPISTGNSDAKSESGREFAPPLNLKQTIQDLEVEIIQNALELGKFNQRRTAEILGLTYHQLRNYLRKYSLFENLDS